MEFEPILTATVAKQGNRMDPNDRASRRRVIDLAPRSMQELLRDLEGHLHFERSVEIPERMALRKLRANLALAFQDGTGLGGIPDPLIMMDPVPFRGFVKAGRLGGDEFALPEVRPFV